MKHTREYFLENRPRIQMGVHIHEIPDDSLLPKLQLYVFLPWSSNKKIERNYPVVYICDGYWDIDLAYSVYPHLLFDKAIPECILVGLGYSGHAPDSPDLDALRKIDLAPPSDDAISSKSDYLSRIRNTVIPFVETEFPVDSSFRAIVGTSLGANFAVSALFRAPGLFQAAVALSPIFSSHDRWVFAQEEQYYRSRQNGGSRFLCRKPELPVRFFSAVGELDSPLIVQAAQEFQTVLENRKYRFLDHSFRIIPGEKHGGVKPEGLNRGLRHILAQYCGAS